MTGGDITRVTFDPARHLSGVRMQQGRVQLDADWNEQVDIVAHRERAAGRDLIGPSGAPKDGGGFGIGATTDGTDLTIGSGRIYVSGVLCENESSSTAASGLSGTGITVDSLVLDGRQLAVPEWVRVSGATGGSALVRLSTVDTATRRLGFSAIDTTAFSGALTVRRVSTYTTQPDQPEPPLTTQANPAAPRVLALPDNTAYLAYLDVWERPLTAVELPEIREIALGGPDTATRTRVVAQVRLVALAATPDPLDPDAPIPEWDQLTRPPDGRMAAFAHAEDPEDTPCVLPESGGFQGLENQLYRVQVTDGSKLLWSRENGSVTAVLDDDIVAGKLILSHAAPDRALGFTEGDWVEVTDDTRDLLGRSGMLVRLLKAEGTVLTFDETTTVGAPVTFDRARHTKVRRWDSPGPVPFAPDTDIELEAGVRVRFPSGGSYRVGDHWLIPARTGIADVQWPHDTAGHPVAVPPHGIRHWYARLALVVKSSGALNVTDWRQRFPALTELTAADVAYDNSQCALPDTTSVQDALDRLCQERDLRFHNQHLHGWGIVCGLTLRCGPNPEGDMRHIVTVEPGYAIDATGADRLVDEPGVTVDISAEVARLKDAGVDVLDAKGDGELCLRLDLDERQRTIITTEKFDATGDAPILTGTLWDDFYVDCIGPIKAFLDKELSDDPAQPPGPAGAAQQHRAALTNLANQVINPKTGQQVFISKREDDIIREFYNGLRDLLRSETFCAMFDNARPVPDYPAELTGMGTIFGTGGHSRLRLHPSGSQAWTYGPGANPVKPHAVINRYDLVKGKLIEEIDPVAGAVRTGGAKLAATANTGTGAVLDVAFSPDGKRIFVAIASKNEDNTIFRSGTIAARGVDWAPQVTICGTKLVSLATTTADPKGVYAVGLHKVQVQVPAPKGGTVTKFEWHSQGLFRIDPDHIDPNALPPVPLTGATDFMPTGPMTIDQSGHAVLAGTAPNTDATAYNKLTRVNLIPTPASPWTVTLPNKGTDGLAFVTTGTALTPTAVYTVIKPGASKAIVGFSMDGTPLTPKPIEVADTAIALTGTAHTLLVTESVNHSVRMVNLVGNAFVASWVLPTQLAPAAIAATDAGRVVVLNQFSDTLTVIDPKLITPKFVFPSATLAKYRADMLNAFADLLGGFLQYAKDRLFHHFLVRCPQPTGAEKLWLGCVSIRGRQVYKVCNFSRRRYVKSFPTVGYWLSLAPIQPLIAKAVEWLGCMVLPESFGRYNAGAGGSRSDMLSLESLMKLVNWVQNNDPLSRIADLRGKAGIASGAAVSALKSLSPSVSPPGGPHLLTSSLIGQPADTVAASLTEKGVTVRRAQFDPKLAVSSLSTVTGMFRTPEPGQEVTLCEENGTVKFFSVPSPSDTRELQRSLADAHRELAVARTELGLRDQAVAALADRLDRLEAHVRTIGPMPRTQPSAGPQPRVGSAEQTPKEPPG
jgi:hypothetical protein